MNWNTRGKTLSMVAQTVGLLINTAETLEIHLVKIS